jgi:hypothetical protein
MLTDAYFHSVLDLSAELTRRTIDHVVYTLRNESLIPRARNSLVAVFLQSDCTDMLFIDADVQFAPESVVRMLEMGKPVIGAACPLKHLPLRYAVNFRFDGDEKKRQLRVDDGAIEVEDVGSSFLLVRRSVFQELIEAYPELHYETGPGYASPECVPYFYSFFDTMHDEETNRYLSEDYTFCRRWQAIGGTTWIDPKTEISHVGSFVFRGRINELLDWTADGCCYLKGSTLQHTIAAIFPEDEEPPVSTHTHSRSSR